MLKLTDLKRRKGGDNPYWVSKWGHFLHWSKATGEVGLRDPDGTFRIIGTAENAASAKRFYLEAGEKR